MVLCEKDLNDVSKIMGVISLRSNKFAKQNMSLVLGIIKEHLRICQTLKINPEKISVIIYSKKRENISSIRVFEQNSVIVDNIDMSYNNICSIKNLPDSDFNFVLKVNFLENGKYFDIMQIKIEDLNKIKYKKIKKVTYGIMGDTEIVEMQILQLDVKGANDDMLYRALKYAFEKKTGYTVKNIKCFALDYS